MATVATMRDSTAELSGPSHKTAPASAPTEGAICSRATAIAAILRRVNRRLRNGGSGLKLRILENAQDSPSQTRESRAAQWFE